MEPLKFVQKKDYILDVLRREIFLGLIEDKTEFTQEAISKELKVSRIPVREAFMQLEQEGFLERLPNRHVQVIAVREKNIYHNFCILSMFEARLGTFLLNEKCDLLPIRQAYNTYLRSLSDEAVDVCAECELSVHKQLSLQLCDRCITQTHNKMLSGYLACALKYFPFDINLKAKALGGVIDTLEGGLAGLLPEKFDLYFKAVAQSIKQEVEK